MSFWKHPAKMVTLISKRLFRRPQFLLVFTFLSCFIYVLVTRREKNDIHLDSNYARRYIEKRLQEALKLDKGTGCQMPQLDPFDKQVTRFDKVYPKITCPGMDWVKCYHSVCKVKQEILNTTTGIQCSYSDVIYVSDQEFYLSDPVYVYGSDPYILIRSDHVRVKCTGRYLNALVYSKWIGMAIGLRKKAKPKIPPSSQKDSVNVLVFGFDSTSKNGFIRRMSKSFKYLVEELKATVLNSYNIVGDGTPAAMFPILSGKTELEMPDVRRRDDNNNTFNPEEFIFYKMQEAGYRTAYFEDCPTIGTFQYRFNGFNAQPADHYLRAFFLEDRKIFGKYKEFCVGDTPRYRLMMDVTQQFLKLDGKRFIFSFIVDISHNDFNRISTADDDTVEFLKNFRESGRTKDTLLVVMGDHGSRFASSRSTLQGRLEERLPLMAIRLPDALLNRRPLAQAALEANVDVLTTPHDIHATLLDAVGLSHLRNLYRVQGADFPRAMSILEPIPKNRSCSEAGIEPHWCACVSWENVAAEDPMYTKAAEALVANINRFTERVRSKCMLRTLTSISWVMKQQHKDAVLTFREGHDVDGYMGLFGPKIEPRYENYQAKITVGPGRGVFEGTMTYKKTEDTFDVNIRDISRTNM